MRILSTLVQVELQQKLVGKPLALRESLRHVKGNGRFVDDFTPKGTLHMAVFRSQSAHAKILSIDVEDAKKQDGVVAILTPDIAANYAKPLKTRLSYPKTKVAEHRCLAHGKVRFVGEPIIAVIATDKYKAVDALDFLRVELENLPAVIDVEEALKPESPLLYEEWGDNISFHIHFKSPDLFPKDTDKILKLRVDGHRYTGTPLETRAYLADYDQSNDTLTYYTSTQNPHITRTLLADTLAMAENRIRVIMPDVGGGFGLKHPLYPEELLVCMASKIVGRPVKWVEDRTENLMAMHHAREQRHFIEVATKKDGHILSLKDKIMVNLGVAMPTAGPYSAYVTAHYLTGPYKIKNYEYELYGVVTNKTPYGAYRGFGKADSNYVMERVINQVAQSLGLDPVDVRMRNLVDSSDFPYETTTGALYDSGDYKACLKALLRLIDYPKLRMRQALLKKEGKILGIGIAFTIEPTATAIPSSFISSYDAVNIRMDPSGTVSVLSGAAPQGHGYETVIPQLVADELGVNIESVFAYHGDTLSTPYGLGSYSSRFAVVLAPAIQKAARKLKDKLIEGAAYIFKEDPRNLRIEQDELYSISSGNKKQLRDVARLFYTAPHLLPVAMEPGLDVTVYYKMENFDFVPDENGRANLYRAYPYGAVASVIEVDNETGMIVLDSYSIVHDCGSVINSAVVEGQVIGGIAQGIGGALYEEIVYDKDGNLLSSTFMDYILPSAKEMPKSLISKRTTTPSPFVPGGYKGVGEIGAIGPQPVIANALDDAVRTVCAVKTPLKPEYVWNIIHNKN